MADALASMNKTLQAKAREAGLDKMEEELNSVIVAVKVELEQSGLDEKGDSNVLDSNSPLRAAQMVENKLRGSKLLEMFPNSEELVKTLASVAESKFANEQTRMRLKAERDNLRNMADLSEMLSSLVRSKLTQLDKGDDSEGKPSAVRTTGDQESSDAEVVSNFIVQKLSNYGVVNLEDGSKENETVGLLISTLEEKLRDLKVGSYREKLDALSADLKSQLESLDMDQQNVLSMLAKKLDIGLTIEAEDLGISDQDFSSFKGSAREFIEGFPSLIRDIIHKDELLKAVSIESLLQDNTLQVECLRRCQALFATEMMMYLPKLMSNFQGVENKVYPNLSSPIATNLLLTPPQR
jgi:hypothetical protein